MISQISCTKCSIVLLVSLCVCKFSLAKFDLIVSPFEEVEDSKKLVNRRDVDEVNKAGNNQSQRISTITTLSSDNSSFGTGENSLDRNKNEKNDFVKYVSLDEDWTHPKLKPSVKKACEYEFVPLKNPDNKNCSGYYLNCNQAGSASSRRNSSISYEILEWIQCPIGHHFDSIDMKCIDKSEAQCEDYVCSGSGFFPDPKNPKKFIHCVEAGPKRLSCEPEGTIFNNEAKVCLWNKDELPLLLKLLKIFIWVVHATESPDTSSLPNQSYIYSKGSIFKMVLVAILFPLIYFITIIIVHCELNRRKPIYPDYENTYISNAEEFHRFCARPQFRNNSTTASVISINDMYAGSSTIRQSRTENENHYASTRM